MTVKLRPLRQSRTQLRSTRAGSRMLVHPKGLHENALSDFIRWCPTEPGYTVVAVEVPPKTAPEALEDVLEDLAACPGVLRLIPSRLGSDSTLEFGNWLAQRLGRTVVAHQGSVMIVPGGGLYIPSGEEDVGWLRFEPGTAPVPHSRRFPRPSWDCEPFAEPRDLGPYATLEPLPAGAWIRPAVETPDVLAFRRWLIGSVAVDPLLPRVILGYPGSPMPTIAAVAEFWRSLPTALQPGVRFAGFGGTDEGMTPYGQQLADALDAPVVLGNGVQLAGPSPAGGNEMRTVLRHGVMSWSPYVGDLGYLPVRSTGGIPTDPVAIGHRAPIAGLQEREPGVYEYSHDAVLEVTQSGLWMRSPALPSDSFHVRTEHPNPAHVMVVFDASTHANTHRMQLLATEMVERLEPRVRSVARLLASTATGAARRTESDASPTTTDSPPETPPDPAESSLNLAALAAPSLDLESDPDTKSEPGPGPEPEDAPAAQPPAQLALPGADPADMAAGMATIHVPIATLLASLQAEAGPQSESTRPPSDSALISEGIPNWPEEPVPPAVALYALSWPAQPDADPKEPEADLVSRTVAEVRRAQESHQAAAPEPTAPVAPAAAPDARTDADDIAMVADPTPTASPEPARPALVSTSAVPETPAIPELTAADPPQLAPAPTPADTPALTVADAPPTQLTAAPVDAPPPQPTWQPVDEPPTQLTPAPIEAPPTQLTSGTVDVPPAHPTLTPVDAPPAQLMSAPVDAPPAQLTPDLVELPPAELTSASVDAPPAQSTPVPVEVPPAQLAPSSVDAPPTQLKPGPVETAPTQPAPGPTAAPAAQFTVARRRPRKGRAVPSAPAAPQDTNVADVSAQTPDAPTTTAPLANPPAVAVPAVPPQTPATPTPAEFVPQPTPTVMQPEPQAPTAPPAPQPVQKLPEPVLPAPQPVAEPDQPAPAVPRSVEKLAAPTLPAPQPVQKPIGPAPAALQSVEKPAAPTLPAPQPVQKPTAPAPTVPQSVEKPIAPTLPAPQPVQKPTGPAPAALQSVEKPAAPTLPAPQPVEKPAAPILPAPQPVQKLAEPTPRLPQPVEEPDEPIQYGAFQLVSSSADLSFGAPSAPAAPAPEKPRPAAVPPVSPTPAPAAPVAPPPAPPIGNAPNVPVSPMPLPQNQVPVAPAPRPVQPQPQPLPLPMQQSVQPAAPAPAASSPAAPPAPVPAPAPAPAPAAPVQAPQPQVVPQPQVIQNAAPATQVASEPGSAAGKRRPAARPAKSSVRVQPVPTAQCSVLPREGGLAKERDWLRRNLSKQYDATASSVARILSEYPGLRAGSSASDTDVLTDLVALRLYLTGKIGGLDEAVRAAKVGPHVPLARCVAAGLRRLPSYRGPLRTRAALSEEQVRWYGARSLVTEWSFLPAIASAGLELPGSAEILIWSMSARRTGLLDPARPDQVVFPPGTSFKVLSVGSGDGGPEIRLRELTRTEIAADGTVQSMPALDEFAVAALEEAGKAWRQVDPVESLPADRKDWFASAPGLLLAQPAAAGAARTAKKGESA